MNGFLNKVGLRGKEMSKDGIRLRLATTIKVIERATEQWDIAFWLKMNGGRTSSLTGVYYGILASIWMFMDDLADFVLGGRYRYNVEDFIDRC